MRIFFFAIATPRKLSLGHMESGRRPRHTSCFMTIRGFLNLFYFLFVCSLQFSFSTAPFSSCLIHSFICRLFRTPIVPCSPRLFHVDPYPYLLLLHPLISLHETKRYTAPSLTPQTLDIRPSKIRSSTSEQEAANGRSCEPLISSSKLP